MDRRRALSALAAAAAGCARTPPPSPRHVYWQDAEGVTVVALVGPDARDLVAGERELYFREGPSRIMAVPKEGGAARLVHAAATPLRSLATDGEHVYWHDENGAIGRVATSGGIVERVHAGRVHEMLVDGAHVYVTQKTAEGASRLLRVRREGSAAELVLDGLAEPKELAASSDRLFWVDRRERLATIPPGKADHEIVITVESGVVASVRKSGTEPLTFEETNAGWNQIVSGGGRAYFGTDERYWVWDPAAGALAPWPLHAYALRPAVADERGLYSLASGWVCRITPKTATPVWLAPHQYGGRSIAVDATHVYWIRGEEALGERRTYIGRALKR